MSKTVAKRLNQYQADFENHDMSFTELWTLYPEGKPQNVLVVFRGLRLEDGRMAMQCEVVGQSGDEPENVRSTEALLHTDVLIMLFSQEGPSLYLNPVARHAFGGMIDKVNSIFVDQDEFFSIADNTLQDGELRRLTQLATVDGVRWFDLRVKSCLDAVSGKPAFMMTAIDVSELKEARDTARHLANRDQLTGLHNRTYLQRHFAWLEGQGSAEGTAIVVFDVDNFKQINDRYGHEAGDTVLREIAQRTAGLMLPTDLVARLGGDEFVIVMHSGQTRQATREAVERVRRAVCLPMHHGKTRLDATISVGISFVEGPPDFKNVMREADIALYRSKNTGRDCVTVFDAQMGIEIAARECLDRALRTAINQREFTLHYQPRLDLKSGKIIGAEGLVRWDRPGRGLVYPAEFIEVCEENGLIDEIGAQVFEMGCAQAIAWHKQGVDLELSLNVSPRQFADNGFIEALAALAAQHDFPKGKIELELTENALIGDPKKLAKKLRQITTMGYKIAIDDFGTGYSNLSYITQFPLTCIKIDRSFIQQLPSSGPIVQLILTLGRQIGATVVSEGVETVDHLDWLSERDCDEVQGFLITKPLPLPEFEAFAAGFSVDALA
ncbi:putative bifunctional diguanylate cyclase/phosphodiesterase [Pseudooctadecabacter jejudonensis]|nr:bifunctional diguanylate cyclase/phosphodiesterase [Pseudooctadecabacter jejudonensis]